jgi:antitoxin component HigA of HigAB toxin-antitoxin module
MVKLSTIRAEIARAGLKQADLAEAIGVRADILSLVLNGRRKLPVVLDDAWAYVKHLKAAQDAIKVPHAQ